VEAVHVFTRLVVVVEDRIDAATLDVFQHGVAV
jgi:hypothetical protein